MYTYDIIKVKNHKIADLSMAIAQKKKSKIIKLAIEISKLEGTIACEYMRKQNYEGAVVNLMSESAHLRIALDWLRRK